MNRLLEHRQQATEPQAIEEPQEPQHPETLDIKQSDVNQLEILQHRLKDVRHLNRDKAVNDLIDQVLNFLNQDDIKNNLREICLFVMWKLERIILKPKAGDVKRSLAVKILKRLFHDDENICGLFIDSLMHDHKQVGKIKRLGLKVFRYFVKNE
jgi:stress-induced morphogen